MRFKPPRHRSGVSNCAAVDHSPEQHEWTLESDLCWLHRAPIQVFAGCGRVTRCGCPAQAGHDEQLNALVNQFACATGLSLTDSPQPQAEVWFGLLNTNCAESLSVL